MNNLNKLKYRNQVASYVKSFHIKRNIVNLNVHNSWEHELIKCRICFELKKQDVHFVTEAPMESSKRKCIADILVLDTAQAIEIRVSETLKELKEKTKKFPKILEIVSVTDHEQYFNGEYQVIREKEI